MNCHNGEEFLDIAIRSVYEQTYTNWEIILWDNASDDKTSEIVARYNNKIRYYRSKIKDTLGKARVKAVDKANGDFLTFLDCDDQWYPDKLCKQINAFKKNKQAGLIYSRANIINQKNLTNIFFPKKLYLFSGSVFKELVKDNFIPFVSVLIPKKVYYDCGGFLPYLINATDYDLFLKISLKYDVIALNEITCAYREHDNNLSKFTKVIGAEESLKIVSRYNTNLEANVGIDHKKVGLVFAYIKEFKFLNCFTLVLKNPQIIVLILKRLLNKLKK